MDKLSNFATRFALIFGLLGVLFSTFIGRTLYHLETKAIVNGFEKDVSEEVASIEQGIEINFEALSSLEFLFDGFEHPSFADFQRVAKETLVRHEGIETLEWIPRVPKAERSAFESSSRKQFPKFKIREQDEKGHLVPARAREEHFPVAYVEPPPDEKNAFGFDLASIPSQAKTLHNSRDMGKLLAIADIAPAQHHARKKVFLAVLPVYQGIPATPIKRREQLKGFILGSFRISALFEHPAIASTRIAGIDMTLLDDEATRDGNILYSYKSSPGKPITQKIIYRKSLSKINGRKWTVVASPTAEYVVQRRSKLPVSVAGGVIVLFAVLAGSILNMGKRARLLEQTVTEKTRELNKANEKLKLLSRTDSLTGITNRQYFDAFLEKEWLRAIRNQSPITLLLANIDYFKSYNNTYGSKAGDECLKNIALSLQKAMHRPADMAARYGGEVFALLLPDTGDEAITLAEIIRESVELLEIPHKASETADIVTISAGMSTITPARGSNPIELIASADKALYRAKEAGRNRVEKSD